MLTDEIDAAIVISNDSDLAYPISFSRGRVPIGLINPTKGYLAGHHDDGVGNHWWYQLQRDDLYDHQLPTTVGTRITKPKEW